MIVYYILKQFLASMYRGQPFCETNIYKGFSFYKDQPSKNKKSLLTVFFELERLSIYWKCFPDPYFKFGMFYKSYKDYDLMKSFLPQYAYTRIANSVSDKYNILINDKILFYNIMKCYALPTTQRYFVWQNGQFYKENSIISDTEVDSIINKVKDDRIFVKRFRGGGASGISVFSRKENGYYDNNNNRLSATLIKEKYSDSNYIFEKQITQESTLRKFNPDTVNTIRVLTKDDVIVSAAARFGRRGTFVDNATKGGIVVSIDIESGVLGDYGVRKYDMEKYYEHPDTALPFKNTHVTQWEDTKALILDALKLLPYYKSVGFDIATTDNGPIIIEINTGVTIDASEMGKERGIADKFI